MTDAFGGAGGIAQYNRDLLGALAVDPDITAIDVMLRAFPEPTAIPEKVRQFAPLGGRAGYIATAGALALARRPETIFCGHLNLAPLAEVLAKFCGARLVIQLHGVEAWSPPAALQRRAVEAADLVLCVSRYTRAMFLGWADITPERVAVLPNTIGDNYAPGDKDAARRRLSIPRDYTVLLSVGRLSALERYKGHDRIIELMPQLAEKSPNLVYLIAGEGDDQARLEALAVEFGVKERVRFLGLAPMGDLPDLYCAADLFVLASSGEGFGIVFLEAMACGTPAIGLAEAGARDALGDGGLGQAVTRDELFDALRIGLGQPRPDPLELAGRVRDRFGPRDYGDRARRLFRSVASSSLSGER